jgi:hypothetical protein
MIRTIGERRTRMKTLSWLAAAALIFLACCGSHDLQKLVAIGDSSTMGIQDGGLLIDYQHNSYPYLIAQRLGIGDDFQQPLVNPPGIGVPPFERPLKLENGRIIPTYLTKTDPLYLLNLVLSRLANPYLERPYDNLAVNGARLHDIRNTTGYRNSISPDNFFFDIVLRNLKFASYPYFNDTTVLEQAVSLNPTILLLWIGNNDILGALLNGGDETQITEAWKLEDEFRALLQALTSETRASIFMANIPGYIPYAFALDSVFIVGTPMLFDLTTLSPIDFSDALPSHSPPLYLPLLIEESETTHVLLSAGLVYGEEGMGIPGEQDLTKPPYNFSSEDAQTLFDAMTASGLLTDGLYVGQPLTGEYTITNTEQQVLEGAVETFNSIISDLSRQFHIPLVDLHSLYDPDNPKAFGGYSGKFVLHDQLDTVFSLDGVHINNLGHAVVANAFIEVINRELSLNLQEVDPEEYRGQYEGLQVQGGSKAALRGVKHLLRPPE